MAAIAPDWTNQSAAQLKAFLSTPTGQDFLAILRAQQPKLGGKNIEEKALNASVREGYEGIVEFIGLLSEFTAGARRPSAFIPIRDEARSSTQAEASRPSDERTPPPA